MHEIISAQFSSLLFQFSSSVFSHSIAFSLFLYYFAYCCSLSRSSARICNAWYSVCRLCRCCYFFFALLHLKMWRYLSNVLATHIVIKPCSIVQKRLYVHINSEFDKRNEFQQRRRTTPRIIIRQSNGEKEMKWKWIEWKLISKTWDNAIEFYFIMSITILIF